MPSLPSRPFPLLTPPRWEAGPRLLTLCKQSGGAVSRWLQLSPLVWPGRGREVLLPLLLPPPPPHVVRLQKYGKRYLTGPAPLSPVAGGGTLGYPPPPWEPHPTGPIDGVGGWVRYLPTPGAPCGGGGGGGDGCLGIVEVVVGDGCDPKGRTLDLPPVEVQGRLPPQQPDL